MLELEWIKECVTTSSYYYSKHGDNERQNDNLSIAEVEEAMRSSEILEHYTDTGRGESCLLVGFTAMQTPIHIVCGKRGDEMVIITLYIPGPPKFLDPFRRADDEEM